MTKSLLADDAQPVGRSHESFDFGWRFALGDTPGAEQSAFDDTTWRALDLPHDWSIEGPYDENAPTGGPGGYLPTGIGWYRKTFTVPETSRGRHVEVTFDGVYMNSTVWINGQLLGTHPYGYTPFTYDLTPHLKFGDADKNVIVVRVENSKQRNSRWYSGSGIYRHTWLTTKNPVRIVTNGVYATASEISPERALIRVRTRVRNDTDATAIVTIKATFGTAWGNWPRFSEESEPVGAHAEQEFDQIVAVPNPNLWSPESPHLLPLAVEASVNKEHVDSDAFFFGIRSIAYDVDRGFLLNGTPVKMKGVCLHHDGGAVGAAVPEAVLERRLRALKDMGVNAIRCSHNPMAPEFYDLCDRLGFLVMDEIFDEWTVRKPQINFGYSDYFNEWSERDLVAMIHRDRNHPCVVMWSAGNEIGEQRAPNGPDVLRKLVEIFHREDPTRPVTAAMDNVFTDRGNAPEAFTDLLDIVGYNYVDRWVTRRETYYADDRVKYPQRKMVGTECNAVGGVRGAYDFPQPIAGAPAPRPRYTTAMIRSAELWKFEATHDYVIGDFIWTGIDYLGESRWPRKNAASGALDTCGFPKDAFYFYQSIWSEKPMVHLLPHWNWAGREGQTIPVIAFTNCDVVELFLNGKSLGAKAREFPRQGAAGGWNTYARPQIYPTTADLHLAWDVPYAPGELKAVGWKDGKQIAEDVVRTAGAIAALEVSADRATLAADARGVAHITVRAKDANGVFVPLANNRITFEISGPAKLIGVDNGDPSDHESYQANTRALFNGMALALVQTTREAGAIRVTARAEGLPPAVVEIAARAATAAAGK